MKKLFLILAALVTGVANAATVSRVDVTGNKRMDAESVRILAEVKVGDNVNDERANVIAKKLQESGYFSKVSVQMSGNTLKINITEAPIVNMVTVEGNDEVSTDDLKKEIKIAERSAFDESVVGADVTRMLTVYQRKGFFGTKISPKKIVLDDNRVNVVYEIKEGHPTYIHPMLEAHYIQWIAVQTDKGNQRKVLQPGQAPEAEFALLPGEKVIAVYEYCNLHGLYKA